MLVFTFKKGFWKAVRNNSFIRFNLLVVLFNIIPYWSSPDVYPKYIMMLVPMVYTVFLYFFLESTERQHKLRQIFESILITAASLLTAGYLALPFVPAFSEVGFPFVKSLLLFLISSGVLYLLIRLKKHPIVLFAIILIIGRLAFDWFVWPQRAPQYVKFEEAAYEVASITGNEPVKYFHAPMLQYGGSYYMTLAKWQIIGKENGEPKSGIFYITDDAGLEKLRHSHINMKTYFEYPNVEDGRTLYLIKILDGDAE
jgi:hypothetical protein